MSPVRRSARGSHRVSTKPTKSTKRRKTARTAKAGGAGAASGPGDMGRTQGRADRSERANIYDEVTRRIIGELEDGRFPWVQPWGQAGTGAPGLPRNAATGRPYSGINILILWGAAIAGGYPAQGWLTFRQALDAGGAVRKGERGVTVVFADRFVPRDKDAGGDAAGDAGGRSGAACGEGEARGVPFLKRFTVFNVAQCERLPRGLCPEMPPLPERDIVPLAEALIAASGVEFRIGGSEAFYAPGPDIVQVPPQPAFFVPVNYYRTCLHELTHATGHASRLGRDLAHGFGSPGYAREELVAELGSAFLCASLGIVPTVRHADYLASWLDLLHGDNRAIFRAASAASKAADWLLARLHAKAPEAVTA